MEYRVATGPETGYRQISDWTDVAGKHSRIYYSIKGQITATEVYQNYLTAFRGGKFSLLANKLHPERNVSNDVGGNTWLVTFYRANPFPSNSGIKINQGSGTMGGTFYIAAKKDNIYMAISGKRYSDQETVVLLDVLETDEMDDNLITVNADYIADEIFSKGKVALQGILFDFNDATIKEESAPLLSEIAAFMDAHPSVVIFVVGHTDMTGNVDYNINLSQRRAQAITDYLISQHQIGSERLLPYGIGPLAPTKTNQTETGREQNRRVELVVQSM
ncbi:MAG: OmpA family protein [Bacteroidetes bacterium]|nr:OmpA family protein [Bacteroidota bacterium]